MRASRFLLLGLMPVAALVLSACAGSSSANESQATATSTAADPSADFAGLVDIGGRKMYLECQGVGSPTVVLVSGYRGSAADWHTTAVTPPTPDAPPVFDQVAEFTRVCAYDRPGTPVGMTPSRSDPAPMPVTAEDMVNDLHALLQAADVPGPFVLVGHSFAGLAINLYARTYPSEVVGLMFVDAQSVGFRDAFTDEQWEIQRMLLTGEGTQMEAESLAEYPDLERVDADRSYDQVRAAPPLQQLPLTVLSADESVGPIVEDMIAWGQLPANVPADWGYVIDAAQQQSQASLAQLAPGAKHITDTNSGHLIQYQQPQLVSDEIREMVDTVRSET